MLVPHPEGEVVREQDPEFAVVEFILDVEVNGQHPFQGSVVLFNRFGRIVEFGTNVVLELLEVLPAGLLRH